MGGGPDLDAWLEKLRSADPLAEGPLAEDELKILCEYVRPSRMNLPSRFDRIRPYANLARFSGHRDSRGGIERAAREQPGNGERLPARRAVRVLEA
jgi:hypothetical protein